MARLGLAAAGVPVLAVRPRMPGLRGHETAKGTDALALTSVFGWTRSEEHTSELQSLRHLVCRLLLEKKKKQPSRRSRTSRRKIRTSRHGTGTSRSTSRQ